MQSGLLSLDPDTVPPLIATLVAWTWSCVQRYGWITLLLVGLAALTLRQYRQWNLRRAQTSLAAAEHAEETAMRVRQARLQQQAAWAAAAPSLHRSTKQQMSDEEKRLQRVYGEAKHDTAAEDDSKLTMEEVYGSEFYTALKKKRKGAGGDDSSSSDSFGSSSSSSSSGFKPYRKPPPPSGGGGGSRRFGSGPPKKGG